ncbi:MAG: hypothetical protein M0R77_10560 [Gammaproteobacteria bacterium]|nr:hypothetical protein [Gammaproteobacteria bacterium]
MTDWQAYDLSYIVENLASRRDTYANFTLQYILENRTFTLEEQIQFLVFLFTDYQHLIRSVQGHRPDCSERSCTGEIFSILDTWEEAWTYVILQGTPYMGYSQHLYEICLLCR